MSTSPENETPIWERIRDLEATNKDLKTALKIANQHLTYLRDVQTPPEAAPVLPLAALVSVLQSEVSVLRTALTDEQNRIATLETALVNKHYAVQREKNRVSELEKENANLRKGRTPAMPEPAKALWEPKGGPWVVGVAGVVSPAFVKHMRDVADFGLYRDTKKQAECAAKAMRAFNRLLAYRDEVEPDFYSHKEVYLYRPYMRTHGCWRVQKTWAEVHIPLRVAFVSRENCLSLCEKLNSGEVVL